MRVVLDTNVVVSALIWGGTPYKLIEAAAGGELVVFTSPALLSELRMVLRRGHLAPRLEQQRGSVEEAVTLYTALAVSVSPNIAPRVVQDDADDDQVIAAAVAAGADLIVSGDRHLLRLGRYANILIVTPAQAIGLIAEAGRDRSGKPPGPRV